MIGGKSDKKVASENRCIDYLGDIADGHSLQGFKTNFRVSIF